MKAHEAARLLSNAEDALRTAREIAICPRVLDQISIAFNAVNTVGDGLYPKIIDEIRKEKAEEV
jgi:hypothetical protein